ncbi:MAG: hypothetical protein IJ113_03420 [Eggerthellaceae bacterium]|nr:hypothetical protein [Eggerthellaceae bacterium]MBQ9147782.1 hypothetical protein [Rikenellaceae bacterium]
MSRVGRINVSLYWDELERIKGGVEIYAKQHADELTDAEQAYWLGVSSTVAVLQSESVNGDWQQFITALQLHFKGNEKE